MKLFGGGKKDAAPSGRSDDEFNDSPVENVSLSAPHAAAPPPVASDDEPRPHFGINQAIELMRALPVDQNVELVVQVIKTTLESLRVRVADIIEDATRKEQSLETRVADLRKEIGDFEKEIQTRKDEITRHEADHSETSSVKARLELAQKAERAAAAKPAGKAKTGA